MTPVVGSGLLNTSVEKPMVLASQTSHLSIKPLALALSIALAPAWVGAQEPARELSTVVVSASGFEQEIKEAPASISVITREELENKKITNLADALSEIPGVDSLGGTGKTGGLNVSIRGMPSDYTLVLIDGRRQNVSGEVAPNGFGETSHTFIPPIAAIERIEVIRGPMSTLYGSDAMGGVVNIITRKVAREWMGQVGLSANLPQDRDFGSTVSTSLYLSGPLIQDRLGVQIRGSFLDRGETKIDNPPAGAVSQRGPAPVEGRNYSIGTKFTFTPSQAHEFWLDLDRSRQSYDNSEGQLGGIGPGKTSGIPFADGGYSTTQRFYRDQFAIGHRSRFAAGVWESSLMHAKTETLGRVITDDTDLARAGQPRTLENTNLVLDTKFVAPIGNAHLLTVGGQYLDSQMRDGIVAEKFTTDTKSLFVEDEWQLVDGLALTTGLRYDHNNRFGGQFSPRAYLVWSANDKLTVKGGVSRGYKTPKVNQLHGGVNSVSGQGTSLQVGNPDLKPETSTSTEVGLTYDNLQGWITNLTLFNNDFKDKITSETLYNCGFAGAPAGCVLHPEIPASQETFSWSYNADKAVTRGIEFGTKFPLAHNLSLSANYTYTYSRLTKAGTYGGPLANTPKHAAHFKLDWRATERTNLWLKADYRGKSTRFGGDPAALTGTNKAIYEQVGDINGYWLLSAGGAYKAAKNVTLTASIFNLLDKDFLKATQYTLPNGTTGQAYNYWHFSRSGSGYLHPSRTFWVGANITF